MKRLPVDVLKVDRSFVKDVLVNKDDSSLVQTIIAIGHGLNLRVVAEGAEEEEQVKFLAKYNCDCVQGYYFSKPVPAKDFADLLKNWKPKKYI